MITRKRGVFYRAGRPVPEAEQQRYRKIGIPPAYTNVEVYPNDPKLLATAVDSTGKKHYYYSEKFLEKQRKLRKGRATQIDFSKSTSRSMTETKRKLWMPQPKLLDIHPRCLKNITYCNEIRILGSQNVQGALGSSWKGSGRRSSHHSKTIQEAPNSCESKV